MAAARVVSRMQALRRGPPKALTAAQVAQTDAAVTALLTDGRFPLPTVLPDGSYAGQPAAEPE